MKRILAVLVFSAVQALASDIYTFNLVPGNGRVQGSPGSTVGWGYSIQNQSSSLWLVTTGAVPGVFQSGTPDVIFDFPIIAPATTINEPFNLQTLSGILALTWDSNAPLGTVEAGNISLSAEWWDGDPLDGGQLQFAAPSLSQAYTASVAPEPSAGALIALAILLFGLVGVMRPGSKRPVTN